MVHSAKTMVTLKQIEFDVGKQTAQFEWLSGYRMYFNVYLILDISMELQIYIVISTH